MKLRCEPTLDHAKEAAMLLGQFLKEQTQARGSIVERLQAVRPERRMSEQEKALLEHLQSFKQELWKTLELTPKQSALLKPDCRLEHEGEPCTAVLFPFYHTCGLSVAEISRQIKTLSEGALRRNFLNFLVDWDEKCTKSMPDEIGLEEFVKVLEVETDLSPEEKWHIIDVFADFHAAFEQAMVGVARLESALKERQGALSPYFRQWEAWIRREVEAGQNGQLLPLLLGMVPKLEDEVQELVVSPSLSMMIGVTITMEGEAPMLVGSNAAELRVGLAVPAFIDLPSGAIQIGETELLSAMKLLGEKSKFDILTILLKQPAYGAQLAQQLGLSPATISHHLGSLLNEGLVTIDLKENRAYYATNTPRIRALLERLRTIFPSE